MSVSVLMIVLGVVIIATRGPLIIAPARTLELYRNLVTGRPRVFGGILLLSGLAIVLSLSGETGQAARIVTYAGWLLVAVSLIPLMVPSAWCSVATLMLAIMDEPAIARSIGVVAVVFGAGVVYYGITIL